MKAVQFDYKGITYKGYAQKVSGQLWLHFQGKTFIYENAETTKRKKSRAQSGSNGDVMAPMPGKITKVLAQKEQNVKVGDLLVVMEAMKMEYTLKAEAAGVVTDIKCKVGDQVQLGQSLAKIKKGDT